MIAEEVMKEDEINEAPADTIRGVLSKLFEKQRLMMSRRSKLF